MFTIYSLLPPHSSYTHLLTPLGILYPYNNIADKILHHDSFDSERNIKILHFDSVPIMYSNGTILSVIGSSTFSMESCTDVNW